MKVSQQLDWLATGAAASNERSLPLTLTLNPSTGSTDSNNNSNSADDDGDGDEGLRAYSLTRRANYACQQRIAVGS